MSAPSNIQHDKSKSHKWLGTNRGTHWTVAGMVAVIIFGSYFIYSIRNNSATTTATAPAATRTPAVVTTRPLTLKE